MRALLSLSWFALVASATWDLRDTNGNLIKDRQQWQTNNGYCGEISLMMAGMHLAGQYVSEYDVRAAANPGEGACAAQGAQAHQLLIGDVGSTDTNDKAAADKLKLRYAFYTPIAPSTGNVSEYLGWIKAQLRQGGNGRRPLPCIAKTAARSSTTISSPPSRTTRLSTTTFSTPETPSRTATTSVPIPRPVDSTRRVTGKRLQRTAASTPQVAHAWW